MPTLTRHPLKSGALQLASRPWPPRRAMPSGLDQQGRYLTRAVRSERWADTVATDYGSADALEPAEACTDVGAETGDLEPGPALLASLVGPVLIVLVSAICALLLAAGWPMAWPLG